MGSKGESGSIGQPGIREIHSRKCMTILDVYSQDLLARRVTEATEAMLALKVNKAKRVCKAMMALLVCLAWLESW
jgi:hypothetical protein